jgi:hypothetical protein
LHITLSNTLEKSKSRTTVTHFSSDVINSLVELVLWLTIQLTSFICSFNWFLSWSLRLLFHTRYAISRSTIAFSCISKVVHVNPITITLLHLNAGAAHRDLAYRKLLTSFGITVPCWYYDYSCGRVEVRFHLMFPSLISCKRS